MKVISGILKGRKIEGFDISGTRPTMDRVKESLFAMIQDEVSNSIVLDLFSGTGNLGIEALSNGAEFCYFNDVNSECIKVMKENISLFNLVSKSRILNFDYMKTLKILSNENIKFDIVLLDPPYKKECLNRVIEFLINDDMLNDEALIVCELDNNYLNNINVPLLKMKRYGNKYVMIFKYEK